MTGQPSFFVLPNRRTVWRFDNRIQLSQSTPVKRRSSARCIPRFSDLHSGNSSKRSPGWRWASKIEVRGALNSVHRIACAALSKSRSDLATYVETIAVCREATDVAQEN